MFYGYKCFNKGLINRYGIQFEVGKTYHCDGEIKFGNNGNGFHVCRRLEDTQCHQFKELCKKLYSFYYV